MSSFVSSSEYSLQLESQGEGMLLTSQHIPCSSSEDSEEEVVVCEDDRLITVTVLVS